MRYQRKLIGLGLDSWIVHAWEVFDPDLCTRIVDRTHLPDWFTRLLDPTCEALKTRSFSGLDSWIVHAWKLFDSWMVPA